MAPRGWALQEMSKKGRALGAHASYATLSSKPISLNRGRLDIDCLRDRRGARTLSKDRATIGRPSRGVA